MAGKPSSIEQAHAEGASKAIYSFNNDLWEEFRLSERLGIDPLDEGTPTDRKQDTIEQLKALMLYCYRAGAGDLLEMQKEAGVKKVKKRTKNIPLSDWKRAVQRRFGEAKGEYSNLPW